MHKFQSYMFLFFVFLALAHSTATVQLYFNVMRQINNGNDVNEYLE